MQRLDRTIRKEGVQAPSLPNIYAALAERHIAFRRGEVAVIAAAPGVGKSTLALSLAVRAKVPTLYFSADTHARTMSLRLIAMLTDTDQSVVEPLLVNDPAWAASVLKQAGHIRWSFDSAPSVQVIEQHLLAHIELMGVPPECVVIDNLTDCIPADGESEWQGLRAMLRDFKWLAREYDIAWLALHHTSEGVQGNPAPPRFALQGKVAATPALVLTLCQDPSGFIGVAAVKNRYGPAKPDGSDPAWLLYQPASMQIKDLELR